MFPAASILYNAPPREIGDILALVRRELAFPCRLIEWRGFTTVIPQILVESAPPFVLQPEESEYVAEDIANMEGRLSSVLTPGEFARVRTATGLLDVFAADGPEPVLAGSTIKLAAQTNINPRHSDIQPLILRVADLLGAWVVDHVTPGVRGPGDHSWRNS